MTDKETLKLALEALERYQVKRQDFERFADVITAIKEALAQPEQDSVQRLSALVRAQQITIDKLEAQLEQETVADVRAYAYSGVAKNGEFFEAVLREGANVADGDKLYTSPPAQRKPLTDEEIEKMRHLIDWTAGWSYINFARAIEAAHGIKGEA